MTGQATVIVISLVGFFLTGVAVLLIDLCWPRKKPGCFLCVDTSTHRYIHASQEFKEKHHKCPACGRIPTPGA